MAAFEISDQNIAHDPVLADSAEGKIDGVAAEPGDGFLGQPVEIAIEVSALQRLSRPADAGSVRRPAKRRPPWAPASVINEARMRRNAARPGNHVAVEKNVNIRATGDRMNIMIPGVGLVGDRQSVERQARVRRDKRTGDEFRVVF